MPRDYLNSVEFNDFMTIGALLDTLTKTRKGWAERGQLTAEQHKSVKMAETYLKKFYESKLKDLNPKELLRIDKRLKQFDLKIVDKYTKDIIFGGYEDAYKIVNMEREMFFDWTCEIIDLHCKGCNKCWNECKLYDMLDANFMPAPTGFDRPSCRYSYGDKNE